LKSRTENNAKAQSQIFTGRTGYALLSVAVTEGYSHAQTTVASGAIVSAGGKVDVLANNFNGNSTNASATNTDNRAVFALGIGIALSEATAMAIVDGQVSAPDGTVTVKAETVSALPKGTDVVNPELKITSVMAGIGAPRFGVVSLENAGAFNARKDAANAERAKGPAEAGWDGKNKISQEEADKINEKRQQQAVEAQKAEAKDLKIQEKLKKAGGSVALAIADSSSVATARIGATGVVVANAAEVIAKNTDLPHIDARNRRQRRCCRGHQGKRKDGSPIPNDMGSPCCEF
jgi:hypothetical protein